MARIPIWEIPAEYIIEYSPIGDDIDSFSQKVKYCLEEAFYNLQTLHEGYKKIAGRVPVELENLSDGQVLVYRESLEAFRNEDIELGQGGASSFTQETAHLTRLIENLYLALDVAQLNPGGYDAMSAETFYGNPDNIDNTRSYGITTPGKIIGDDATIVTKPIAFVNEVTGVERNISKAHLVVKHTNVADIVITAEIALRPTATFVKGEVIGIGTSTEQTVTLAHTEDLSDYKFAVYFDGVAQDGMFFDYQYGTVTFTAPEGTIVSADYFYNWGDEIFFEMEKTGTYPDRHNPNRATTQFTYSGTAGKVATIRITLGLGEGEDPEDEIVAIGTGEAQEFELVHPAIANTIEVLPAEATWNYNENLNTVIVTAPSESEIKISYNWYEIVAIGTGEAQGFKLAHQAVANTIEVLPAEATWNYNENLNTVIVTAPSESEIKISYNWRSKSFSVDSFAVMFDE